jgi:hypothetical protein
VASLLEPPQNGMAYQASMARHEDGRVSGHWIQGHDSGTILGAQERHWLPFSAGAETVRVRPTLMDHQAVAQLA